MVFELQLLSYEIMSTSGTGNVMVAVLIHAIECVGLSDKIRRLVTSVTSLAVR